MLKSPVYNSSPHAASSISESQNNIKRFQISNPEATFDSKFQATSCEIILEIDVGDGNATMPVTFRYDSNPMVSD